MQRDGERLIFETMEEKVAVLDSLSAASIPLDRSLANPQTERRITELGILIAGRLQDNAQQTLALEADESRLLLNATRIGELNTYFALGVIGYFCSVTGSSPQEAEKTADLTGDLLLKNACVVAKAGAGAILLSGMLSVPENT